MWHFELLLLHTKLLKHIACTLFNGWHALAAIWDGDVLCILQPMIFLHVLYIRINNTTMYNLTIDVTHVGLVHSWCNGLYPAVPGTAVFSKLSLISFTMITLWEKQNFCCLSLNGSLWVNTQDNKEGILLTRICWYCSIVFFLRNMSMQMYPSQINIQHQFHGVKYRVLCMTWMKVINNSLKSIPLIIYLGYLI